MKVEIRSSDGLALQGRVDGSASAVGAIVLCHPHPQMGGTMNAPLLESLCDELVLRRWAVVRVNFRGIGGSEGRPSTGIAEIADAQGALEYAGDRYPGRPLGVCGWSFGGAVVLRTAAQRDDLVGCAAIAPAVRSRPGITAGLEPARSLGLKVPLLVICGANDEVVPEGECRTWLGDVPARFELVPGGNHFFWGNYERVGKLVGDFFAAQLQTRER